jgi:hypothetical protein
VVGLQVPVEGDLPVRAEQLTARVVVAVGEAEPLQERLQIPEPGVQVVLGGRIERHEDDAGALTDGELDQTALLARYLAEGLLGVHAAQLARQVVRPCVVRAGDPLRHAAARLDEFGAAVPAGVDHRVHDALAVPGDQDGYAEHVQGLVGARSGELARHGEGQRNAPVDGVHLPQPAVGVEVVVDGFRPLLLGLVRGVVDVVLDDTLGELGRLLARRHARGVRGAVLADP